MKWAKDECGEFSRALELYSRFGSERECVKYVANRRSTRGALSPMQWEDVAHHVGTRTVKQCQDKLQTEMQRELDRRARVAAPPAPPSTPVQLPLAATPWGVDVSPYIGEATGRIVWRDGLSL